MLSDIGKFSLTLYIQTTGAPFAPTYNSSTNTFSFTVNGITNTNNTFQFSITNPNGSGVGIGNVGDFLRDGSIDFGGTAITFPGTTTTPKNFRVDLVINFNGFGTYTITQLV
ncbi:hypothetical protein [Flavobacterium sp.]|uniref:hypothetical protein n=1 Tax=Flavobacterium sp. TaxID=239 RepID=UPI0025DA8DF4|nr:hypothetical protein [Flavobacterium sp.]